MIFSSSGTPVRCWYGKNGDKNGVGRIINSLRFYTAETGVNVPGSAFLGTLCEQLDIWNLI